MAPTVHQARPLEREKRPRPGPAERRSDLVCRVKYCNTLPDIPFDPKFINYPFSSNRYVQYKPTSLEKNYKYEVLTEHDLGVCIDLINPDVYAINSELELHPTDEKLLEDDVLMPQDSKRSRHHHVNVSWLRRTEYISTETTRYQPQSIEKIEATVGYATRRKAKEDDNAYTDRESQLEAIERTFADVKKSLEVHYSKPGVTALEELFIYPDFDLWKYPCAQVIFDSDPAPAGRPIPAQLEEMSQAMIRGVMDESGEQFVAYFLPTEDTLEKRQLDKDEGLDYKDEEEYDYTMAREYNWNVKNKASKGYEENYFFVVKNEGVFYNELETRVRLSKRRLKQGQQPNKSRLVVLHRPLNAQEHKTQRYREKMLEPIGDEEEEEEEEELLPMDDGGSRGSRSRSNSVSRSRSHSRSGSRSPTRSRSASVARSVSKSKSRSASRSRSKSGSRSSSESRSKSRSRSRSKERSKSRSRSRSKERSESRSRSQSKERSKSRSRSRSKERSKSRSRSRSKERSKSRSRSRSKERSKSRSRSRSKERSKSRSRSRSPSGTPRSSRSRSRSSSSGSNRSRSSRSRSRSSASDRSSESKKRSRSRSRSSSSGASRKKAKAN